jgi:hypothetical protein
LSQPKHFISIRILSTFSHAHPLCLPLPQISHTQRLTHLLPPSPTEPFTRPLHRTPHRVISILDAPNRPSLAPTLNGLIPGYIANLYSVRSAQYTQRALLVAPLPAQHRQNDRSIFALISILRSDMIVRYFRLLYFVHQHRLCICIQNKNPGREFAVGVVRAVCIVACLLNNYTYGKKQLIQARSRDIDVYLVRDITL